MHTPAPRSEIVALNISLNDTLLCFIVAVVHIIFLSLLTVTNISTLPVYLAQSAAIQTKLKTLLFSLITISYNCGVAEQLTGENITTGLRC